MSPTQIDELDALEDRVAKLEALVGKSDKIAPAQGLDTILEASRRLNDFLSAHPKLAATLKSLDDIEKYKSVDFLGKQLEDEASLNLKVELIMMEEENLRKLNANFNTLRTLSSILDDNRIFDVENLTENLRQLSAKQATLRDNELVFSADLKQFLITYSNMMESINETLRGFNDYLDQYETPSTNA